MRCVADELYAAAAPILREGPRKVEDMIRDRFGWEAVGYGSVALELSRSVPDEFRELAERDL
jgi:DNA polymerase IV